MKKIFNLIALFFLLFNPVISIPKLLDESEIIINRLKAELDFEVTDAVYYNKERLNILDPASFERINEYYLKDKNGIYSYELESLVTNSSYYNNPYHGIIPGGKNYIRVDNDTGYYYVGVKTITKIKDFTIKTDKYKIYNEYLFDTMEFLRGNEEKYKHKLDIETLEFIGESYYLAKNEVFDIKNEESPDKRYCLFLKDKDGVYLVLGNTVYLVENIDIHTFQKQDAGSYRDKNGSYTFADLFENYVKFK